MDLSQTKLSKTEWTMIEMPITEEEKKILQLIMDGYENPTIRRNATETMITYMRIETAPTVAAAAADMEKTIYRTYFEKEIAAITAKYAPAAVRAAVEEISAATAAAASAGAIRRADSIRLENMKESIGQNRGQIFEFIQIDLSKKILKAFADSRPEPAGYYLYTLIQINRSQILQKNAHVQQYIAAVISYGIAAHPRLYRTIIEHAQEYIEKNKYIIKYADLELYEHQKQLFAAFRSGAAAAAANLVLYLAPTGTGKTMSPLGLAQQYRIIFVCVARHVGLALAKSAISMGKKIAFAFGCETAGDIRLHYFAAKDYTKNRRSGGIYKVDNSVGDKVEIMICDIKSYLCAMEYMLAFNSTDKIITYWDEPTITMDVPHHELHETIHRNWAENRIPRVVLSCATLPREEEIMDTLGDFRAKFADAEIQTISSFETKKTVSLVNKSGHVIIPHLLYGTDYAAVLRSVEHCEKHRALLKYLDVHEISRFLMAVQDSLTRAGFRIDEYFTNITQINMSSIKNYYLTVLKYVRPEEWGRIITHLAAKQEKKITVAVAGAPLSRANTVQIPPTPPPEAAGIYFTTKDAHTLTDGPAIYLAEDVNRVGRFYLQQSNIPESVMTRIMSAIQYNNRIQKNLVRLQKNVEDATAKDAEKEHKMSAFHRLPQNVQIMMSEITTLRRNIQMISLDEIYIPNTVEHQMKWVGRQVPAAFKSDIDEQTVEEIVNLPQITNAWKILLLMGIGVFTTATGDLGGGEGTAEYVEIMKKLAYQQKLYMIIASSDYIYGTNYQFCHGIIGKDLSGLSQQKMIQALGRIGRNNIQQDYTVRFRDDELAARLFQSSAENIEAEVMSRLFVS